MTAPRTSICRPSKNPSRLRSIRKPCSLSAGRSLLCKMPVKQLIEVDGRELTISNLDKVFFPESGYTKGQIITYYSDVAEVIIPHLRDRPLTLKRYPDGITGAHFYEKNAPKHTPPWVKRFAVPRSEGGPD